MEPGGGGARPNGMRSTAHAAATIAVVAALLTGCSATGPGPPAPTRSATATTTPATGTAAPDVTATPVATPGPVTLTRTGGIAGGNDTVAVESDGRWTATDRAGASRSGQLAPADLGRLRGLVGAATRGGGTDPSPGRCADAYTYRLTADTRTVSWTDCPTGAQPAPAATALAQLLFQATSG